MQKPKVPIAPDPSDRIKYPKPPTKEGKNIYGDPVYLPNQDFIRDYRKYQKDMERYPAELELWEQSKLARIIINMAKDCHGREDKVQKKMLEKFRIVKR